MNAIRMPQKSIKASARLFKMDISGYFPYPLPAQHEQLSPGSPDKPRIHGYPH
jgi:hypothetical protein